MLNNGLAPYFRLPSLGGKTYDVWQFRQRKNLVLVFLPQPQQSLPYLMDAMDRNYEAYRELNAELLVVVSDQTAVPAGTNYTFPILLDAGQRATARYLGSEAVAAGKIGVFILDQYGEIWQQWLCGKAEELPPQKEVTDTLYLIERQCPE